MFIRFFLEVYLELALSSLVNLDFKPITASDKVSYAYAILGLMLIIALPIASIFLVGRNHG